MRIFNGLIIVAFLGMGLMTSPVSAQTLKGKLSVKGASLAAADFSLVAETADGSIKNGTISSNGKYSVQGVSTSARISILYRSNFYSPLVLGIKKGKNVKPFQAAVSSSFCSSGTPRVVLTTRKKVNGVLNIEVDPSLGVAYSKKVLKDQKKNLTQGASGEAASNCLPRGLSGAGAQSLASVAAKVVTSSTQDVDNDGVSNQNDVDDDDDGLSDAFDPDNDNDDVIDDSDTDNNDRNQVQRLFYFQQLHLDREDWYHPRFQIVSTEMIDNALKAHGGLALEVKSGGTVELDCGELPWCSEGGSGRSREPYPNGLKFPEEMDSDEDGRAEITAGGSGDLQLLPGASSGEIQPGDTFIEEVTDSSSQVTRYVGVLNSVVHTVPGIVSITTGVANYSFDYPATSSSIGTRSNPVLVPATGDVNITVTVYPPLYKTKAGSIIPGILTFITNIPNGPCVLDNSGQCVSGGAGSGVGLLPGTLYSNPSSGWQIVSDGVRSNTTDKISEEVDSVTYTVNLTGSGGVTGWDSGESLMIPVQAMDANSTTSAHNVYFKRQ